MKVNGEGANTHKLEREFQLMCRKLNYVKTVANGITYPGNMKVLPCCIVIGTSCRVVMGPNGFKMLVRADKKQPHEVYTVVSCNIQHKKLTAVF